MSPRPTGKTRGGNLGSESRWGLRPPSETLLSAHIGRRGGCERGAPTRGRTGFGLGSSSRGAQPWAAEAEGGAPFSPAPLMPSPLGGPGSREAGWGWR